MRNVCSLLILMVCAMALMANAQDKNTPVGTIESVAELAVNPGNITVTKDNRIFVSLHQFRPCPYRLAEVTADKKLKAWPSEVWNGEPGTSPDVLNAVLGVQLDKSGKRLWALDNGGGHMPKLVAFDVQSGELAFRHDFKPEVALPGSFLNDLAVDDERGFIYIADIGGVGTPGIVVVDLARNEAWRFAGHSSLVAEEVDMVIDGRTMVTPDRDGQPHHARIGINPITLSADCETLYYGAMSGTNWWAMPAKLLREHASHDAIAQAIKRVGPKPLCDGASTDSQGNHYFTSVTNNAIVVLTAGGKLEILAQDKRICWPDALSFGGDGWLYVVCNQLHLSPVLNGGVEGGKPPYLILRVWTGTQGIAGR